MIACERTLAQQTVANDTPPSRQTAAASGLVRLEYDVVRIIPDLRADVPFRHAGDFAKYGCVAWWREALSVLVLVAATLPVLTLAVLAGPSWSTRLSRK